MVKQIQYLMNQLLHLFNKNLYRVRTLFQEQISRTFPGLFQDSDWFFKGSKIQINPYTPKISMLILLTAFYILHIFHILHNFCSV